MTCTTASGSGWPTDPELAAAFRTQYAEPRRQLTVEAINRSVERGDLPVAIAAADPIGRPVLLVGHSYGGTVPLPHSSSPGRCAPPGRGGFASGL